MGVDSIVFSRVSMMDGELLPLAMYTRSCLRSSLSPFRGGSGTNILDLYVGRVHS